LPSLHALHVFEVAARLGSFTKAAVELRVTQTAVSHQIKQLEDELGALLFRRTGRGLLLTPVGQAWQAELRPHGIRVTCVCPSEVQTNFDGKAGRNNPNKLFGDDLAKTILAMLDMPHRVMLPEFAVFATNPWKED